MEPNINENISIDKLNENFDELMDNYRNLVLNVKTESTQKFQENKLCRRCKINVANPNKAWCESCFRDNKNLTIEEFTEMANKIRKTKKSNDLSKTPSTLRHEVWKKYISENYRKGKCFCCRTSQIEESNFECGHIISRKNGGLISLANLRPICSQCNKSMSSRDMDKFIAECGFWK
jgi:5-methylcytosine-specific restriction endonuclease McrA